MDTVGEICGRVGYGPPWAVSWPWLSLPCHAVGLERASRLHAPPPARATLPAHQELLVEAAPVFSSTGSSVNGQARHIVVVKRQQWFGMARIVVRVHLAHRCEGPHSHLGAEPLEVACSVAATGLGLEPDIDSQLSRQRSPV